MKRVLAGVCVLAVCGSMAPAGPMKMDRVAGDARWVAHLDVAALLNSGIAKFILAEAEKKGSFLEGIAQVRQTLGFDPLKDIRGVTLYGKVIGDETAVVVVDATVDQPKLLELLAGNPGYKAHEHGDRTLHQWTDAAKTVVKDGQEVLKPAKTNYGCFADADTIVVGSTLDLLKGAVDVVDGKADSLAKSGGIKILPTPSKGAFLVGAAEGIRIPEDPAKPQNAIFRTITDVSIEAGELEGNTFASITAMTDDVQKATKLRQIVQGFVALGQMMLAERQDLPALAENIQVGGQDRLVTVNASVPTESLIEMIQFIAAKKKQDAMQKPPAAAALK
ncbi:MAG TPA: hypothetical protein VM695_02735 [Phycisphaerae bacterium]|nr:hypothetical protein [Phycisphaerae bacterium]